MNHRRFGLAVGVLSVLTAVSARAEVTAPPGYTVELLAVELGRSTSAVAPAGPYGGDLYVCRADTKTIERIDPAGTITPFVSFSDAPEFADGPWWPSFDRLGLYGGRLHVVEDPNDIYAVDETGHAEIVVSFPPSGWDNDGMALDPFGHFDGALFLSEGFSGDILAIAPTGEDSLFVDLTENNLTGFRFSPGGAFGETLFVTAPLTGRVYAIPAAHTAGESVPPFIDFPAEGSTVQPNGIVISTSDGFGVDVMLLVDLHARVVLRIMPDGSIADTFLTGLAGPSTLEIGPQGSAFEGALIVHEVVEGNIWIVRPEMLAAGGGAVGMGSAQIGFDAGPNPFRTGVFVRLTGRGERIRVTVHDVGGRRIRTLCDRRVERGESAIAWDGRDESGAIAAAGTYFVRLEAHDGIASRSVVRLRR